MCMKLDQHTERIIQSQADKFMNTVENEYKRMNRKLSVYDRMITDLEHDIELANLSGAELMKDVCLMKKVLKERRIVKTTIIALEHIRNGENPTRALNNVRKAEPKYTVRELKGLKIAQQAC